MPKLLLADDSITIQRVIELTFSGEDVQVVAVGDGEEAIARIRTDRPDIVLADIGMPKRSGYDVAAFVKGEPSLAHIPVLLLAGAFEPVDQARADQVQCDGVLVKPFEPQQVIARVRELVDGTRSRGMDDGRRAMPPAAQSADTKPHGAPPDAGAQGQDARAAGADSQPVSQPPRVVEMPPIVEVPDPDKPEPTPGVDPGDSLDDYFDRLDAAFASLGNAPVPAAPPPRAGLDDIAEQIGVPTIDELLGGVAPPSAPGDVPPPGRITPPPFERPDADATLTAAAAQDADAAPGAAAAPEPAPGRPAGAPSPPTAEAPLAPEGGSGNVIADVFSALLAVEQGDPEAARRLPGAQAAPPVTDDVVEAVTRRVLEQLAPGAVSAAVAQIVSEVAERLVREEIARIRGNG